MLFKIANFEKLQRVNPTITVKKVVAYMKEIESHTVIIDSDEADVDSNRHIITSPVSYKQLIYDALGKNA